MPGPSVQRTIVKSQPEIWSEVSDAASLARHLGAFGEITITRVTPETAVAWEGDRVRGTVTLERSGWGTKVTATAETEEGAAAPEVLADVAEPEPEPELVVAPEPEPTPEPVRLRWWQRLRRKPAPVVQPENTLDEARSGSSDGPAQPDREPVPDAEPILNAMLDHLSAAHHRPFSRG